MSADKNFSQNNENFINQYQKIFSKIFDSLLDYTFYKSENYLEEIEHSIDAIKKAATGYTMDEIAFLCNECNDALVHLRDSTKDDRFLIYDALLSLSKIKKKFNELINTNKDSDTIKPLNNNWEQSNWIQEYTNMTYTGNILIVDDDLLLLAILEKIFRKEGYRVFVSSKATEAVEIIEEHNIDVVLLDLIMPEKSGFEVFSEIKNIKPEIFVIFLTANTKLDDKVKALKAGVDGYITKPFQEQEVIANVESLLKKASIRRTNTNLDSLTGAYTRKYFKYRFDEERLKYIKENTQLSIAFLDIDHFKKVNDTYGHIFGDYLLKAFAFELKEHIRDSDELYRFGGDEFVILLTDTSQNDAYLVLERIRKHIEKKKFTFSDIDLHVSISFSAGISMLEHTNEDMEKLLDKADKALYVSKDTGRGKTTIKKQDDGSNMVKKKILIADEINIIGNLVKSRLTALGYSVSFAKDQKELAKKINESSPDLLLIDATLPQFSASDALNFILSNECNTKVIIVSPLHKDYHISEYLNMGVHDYIKKPFSLQELEQRVRRQLK